MSVCHTSTSGVPSLPYLALNVFQNRLPHTEKGTVVKEASTGEAKAITLNVERTTNVACQSASKAFDINVNSLATRE